MSKELKLSTGESVYVYDDVFSADECYTMNLFAQNSLFRCDYNSSILLEHKTYATLTSNYNEEDVANFGIYKSKNFDKVRHHFKDKACQISWLTLIKMMPEVYYHCDAPEPHSLTLLYYVNMQWDPNYGGETIICNSKGDPELAIATRPNRIAIFNSNLMHRPSGLSPISPPNRFTFVSIWK